LLDLGNVIIGPTDPATQRQDVIRRALVAAVIIGVLPIQQMRIPGWPGVVGGCAVALAYDLPLAYIVFVQKRYTLERVVGLILDSIVLMGASLFVFRAMGSVSSGSDIWMVFLVYIITGGFTLAPIGSLVYTAMWTAWFALATLLYFPGNSQYQEQLPIRLIFFSALGLIALGMAGELQKRRAKVEQQNRETMNMLATLVEARDTDAGAHLRRLQRISRVLALHLGFTANAAEDIANASLLHDVGKANVPDAVLKKPGPLNPDEWRMMQRHTLWGDTLLTDNQDFETARGVARSHHEHFDGTGYPDGLIGQQIPLAARIVAVADVFDALISPRPYKQAWPPRAAILELQRMGGSHLDPDIVEAFVSLWDKGVIQRIVDELEAESHNHEQLDLAA
jgi:HD-GYP domain-containing protein (c-di-GMP phosphodiesterase class II)